ncbi:NUDIX domain-containing protein [Magnetococcales bacterium HHB-1]
MNHKKIIRPCGVIIQQDQLLTQHYRYNGKDRYNLPGGKPDAGENLWQCLQREFKEELFLTLKKGTLLTLAESDSHQRDLLHIIFKIEQYEGVPIINRDQCSAIDIQWLPLSSLSSYALYPEIGYPLQEMFTQNTPPSSYLGTIEQPWF